jgi:hypothetical protein
MAGSQFHNVSDVCTAMKQFSTQTSQSSAKGSFTTLDSLTTFSEAITRLCEEVLQLRTELDELRTKPVREQRAAASVRSKRPTKKKTTASRR